MIGKVEDDLEKILENLPAEEPRSRLEPFREHILRWRRQGRSFQKIRTILRERCHVSVAVSTLHEFTLNRSRPRLPKPGAAPEESFLIAEAATIGPGARLSAEERAAQVEYIRSLNKPELREQPVKPRWNFDADKPRTNKKD